MSTRTIGIQERMSQHGVTRRQFLKFCGLMTAALALPARYSTHIAQALLTNPRPPLVWLEFQDCTGDTESFLRASQPGVDELILDVLSLDYHETLMAPAGPGRESIQHRHAKPAFTSAYLSWVDSATASGDRRQSTVTWSVQRL